MKRGLIIGTLMIAFSLILSLVVIAEEYALVNVHHEDLKGQDCEPGMSARSYYKLDECGPKCNPGYEYEEGLNKCRSICKTGFVWDYDSDSCKDMCSYNPTHHFCKDGHFESLDYDQYADFKKPNLLEKMRGVGDKEDDLSDNSDTECNEGEREIIEDLGAQPQTLAMFKSDKNAMYQTFESAYKRYCVNLEMQGSKCKNK